MFKVSIEANSLEELREKMSTMLAGLEGSSSAEVVEAPSKTTKKASKKKTSKKNTAKKTEKSEETTEAVEEEKQEAPEATKDEAMAALKEVNTTLGIKKAKSILEQFEAERFSDIEHTQYADFVVACNSALQ